MRRGMRSIGPSPRSRLASGRGLGGPPRPPCSPPGGAFCRATTCHGSPVVRGELDSLRVRALEVYSGASLRLGGTELATAERAARELVTRAPFRESGYCVLMEALASGRNTAEALRVYGDLTRLLSEELGVYPSPPTRELHARLLRAEPD